MIVENGVEDCPPAQLSRDIFKQESQFREWKEHVVQQQRLMDFRREAEFWRQKYMELREYSTQRGYDLQCEDRKVRRTHRNASPRGSPRSSASSASNPPSHETSPRASVDYNRSPSPSPRTVIHTGHYVSPRSSPRSKTGSKTTSTPSTQLGKEPAARKNSSRTRSASAGPAYKEIKPEIQHWTPETQRPPKQRPQLHLQLTRVHQQRQLQLQQKQNKAHTQVPTQSPQQSPQALSPSQQPGSPSSDTDMGDRVLS